MMAPTHVVVGAILAMPILVLSPGYAVTAALAAIAGGIFPDFDLFFGRHRRTLHFPGGYWALATPILGWAVLEPGTATVAAAFFLTAAGIHSLQDWFGAPPEARPWESTSNKAVYSHLTGQWLPPKRWVRYDGAPEDLAITVGLGVPGIVLFDSPVSVLLIISVAIGVVYASIRKHIPRYVSGLIE